MIVYLLTIDSVDGDSFAEIESNNKKMVLKFLESNDHEGSDIYLIIKDTDIPKNRIEINNAEKIYALLKQEEN